MAEMKELKTSTVQEVVSDAYQESGVSQKKLADKIGAKSQQAVFNMMNAKNGMRADNFVKLMNAMGYDIIVRDRVTDEETRMVVK